MVAGGGDSFGGKEFHGPIAAGSDSYDDDGKTLSMEQRAEYLYGAGFRGNVLIEALATSEGESGGRWRMNNAGLNDNGSVDWSWMQVNSSAHPWFDTQRAYQDPAYSAEAAYRIYKEAGSLSPWVAWSSGKFRDYLPEAQRAARAVETRAQGHGRMAGAAQPLGRKDRRTAALQAATGMMQGFGDSARQQGRKQRFERLSQRRTGDELREDVDETSDRLVSASDGDDVDARQIQRVQPQWQPAPEQVDILNFESEGALLGFDEGELSRPNSFAWGGFSNGKISEDQMVASEFQGAHRFHPGAGQAFDAMFEAARADGVELGLTDSYRSFAQQVSLKRRKPRLAATPGKSNHGWGLAIDVASQEARRWIQQNGEEFGWYWPEWARPGGNGPEEDWHFEWYGITQWSEA